MTPSREGMTSLFSMEAFVLHSIPRCLDSVYWSDDPDLRDSDSRYTNHAMEYSDQRGHIPGMPRDNPAGKGSGGKLGAIRFA